MKLTVVGTGLLGGAVARAARAHGASDHICGVEPNAEHAQTALDSGVVDAVVDQVPDDADLVVLCCPSDAVADWVVLLKDHPATLCDVGSVKAPIVEQLRTLLGGDLPPQFVPCHPIAGSEKTGPANAPADLFNERVVAITPEPETDLSAISLVSRFWEQLGATVLSLPAAEHDELLSVTSHLPHYLAFAFMLQVEREALPMTGGGFSDFTRIAASNPDMWWRIFKMNRKALLNGLAGFETNLAQLREALEADDDVRGLELLVRAARRRSEL